MSILTIDPIPGAETDSAPVVGTPVKLADLPPGIRLRSVDGSPVGVIYMGASDTTPSLRVQVVDAAGYPVELYGITCELLIKQRRTDAFVSRKAAQVTAPVAGYLEYEWEEGDTIAGAFKAQFVLADADGDQLTLPGANGIYVEVS